MEHTRELVTGLAAELFPAHPPEEILGYLDLYGTESHEHERERVQYCILKLSEGDLDKLISLLDASVRDYRDIIMWAESPPTGAEEAQRMVTQIYERFMNGTPVPDVKHPPDDHSAS
jgi:hypothetical protein